MSNVSELRRQAALFLVAARRAEDADAVRIFRNLAASVLAWAEDVERLGAEEEERQDGADGEDVDDPAGAQALTPAAEPRDLRARRSA